MLGLWRVFYKAVLVFFWTAYSFCELLYLNALDGESSPRCRQTGYRWGQRMMKILNMELTIHGSPPCRDPCLYVANHTSFLDIVVWMANFDLVFVAKASVRYWPLFGRGAKGVGCVFVNRQSPESRLQTAFALGDKIKRQKTSVAIFPEGTSTIAGVPWKKGSFKIAHEEGILVQAGRLFFFPVRDCAYVGRDSFVGSFYRMARHTKIIADLELFSPTEIGEDVISETKKLETLVQESQQLLLKQYGYSASFEGAKIAENAST